MQQVKFYFTFILSAVFAVTLFAQPRAVNMAKIKMQATIATDLQQTIESNDVLLKSLNKADQNRLKNQWLGELRMMHGWYDTDKKFDQQVKEMEKAMARDKKFYVQDYNPNKVNLDNKVVLLIPRKGGYEIVESYTKGTRPTIPGSIAIDFPDEIYDDISADAPITKGQLKNIRTLENKAIKRAIMELIGEDDATADAAGLPSDDVLKELGQGLIALRDDEQPEPKRVLGYDKNDQPIYDVDQLPEPARPLVTKAEAPDQKDFESYEEYSAAKEIYLYTNPPLRAPNEDDYNSYEDFSVAKQFYLDTIEEERDYIRS